MQVPHCGYCQNGMMIQAADLLATTKRPSEDADPHGDERPSVPLRHLSENPDRDPEGRGRDGEGRCVMTAHDDEGGAARVLTEKEISRSRFLKGGGALVVGLTVAGARSAARTIRRRRCRPTRAPSRDGAPPDATQIDNYLQINADNTATLYTG